MAILNKRISSATLPQLQNDARLGSIIRDVASAPATENAMYRTINPSVSTNQTPAPAYVSQLTSALREMQPQNYTSMVAPTRSNNVSLMSSQMPDMSGVPNISKGPITSITQPGDTARQKIGSTTSTSGGIPSAVVNALAGAVMGLGAQKIINSGNKSTTGSNTSGTQKPPVTSTTDWKSQPNVKANSDGTTYTRTNKDGSKSIMDKDGKVIAEEPAPDKSVVVDNGDHTHTVTSPDGTVTVYNDEGTVISVTPPMDMTSGNFGSDFGTVKIPTGQNTDFGNDFGEITIPHAEVDYSNDLGNKKGGLITMMKNGGVPHYAGGGVTQDNGNGTFTTKNADGSTVTKDDQGNIIRQTDASGNILSGDTSSNPVQSILDLLGTSGGAAGAGGLLAALLSSTGGNTNNVNTGLDMSTYGLLNPRTTNFGMGPARYVPHSDYSQRGSYTPNAELLHNLNAPASNPVNEGDYKDPYITNRPGTTNNMTGGTDINSIIAQIVDRLRNKQLASQVSQASTGNSSAVNTATPTASAVKTVTSSSDANAPAAGGFAGIQNTPQDPAEYAKLVAAETARKNAEQAGLDNWHISPSSPFYAAAQGKTGQALNDLKYQDKQNTEKNTRRQALSDLYGGGGFKTTGGYLGYDPAPDETNNVVTDANGNAHYLKKADQAKEDAYVQNLLMKQGNIINPDQPWNIAATDDKIKAAQDALAKLHANPGADPQATLQNFLKTTTFTAEDLNKASNGLWGLTDLSTQMAGNPNLPKPDVGGIDTIPKAKALRLSTHDLPNVYDPNSTENSTANNIGSVDDILKSVGVAGGSTTSTPVNFGVIQDEQPKFNGGYPIEQQINSAFNFDDSGYPVEQPQFNGGYPAQDQYAQVSSGPTPDEIQAMIDAQNAYSSSGGAKKGGAIHKATGGLTHYTYGKPADVLENLGLRGQQMAQGGLPHVSNVPIVQGRMDFRQGSAVHGEGDGQSDDIPAMLADGEYVIDAETVAQIGNGSTKAGAQALDKFRESIRAHKRSAPINKIPPKTKALTSYLKVK
jgi:hypothetical protein